MRNAGAMTLETAGLSPSRPGGQVFNLNIVADIAVPAIASGVAMARNSLPLGPVLFAGAADARATPW